VCGVFGIRSPERDVSRVAYFGLFALQHRGQESAGIAVSDNGRLTVLRDMGLVSQVFDEQNLSGLRGDAAIGHTRYSTTGTTAARVPSLSATTATSRTRRRFAPSSRTTGSRSRRPPTAS
jgi:amidophosphoribosyltransferase